MHNINLAQKIGRGYKEFFNSKHRYLVCKGGRGSKKSTTAAQKVIYTLLKYRYTNALIIRKTFNSHKDSTYAQLKWAVKNLGVEHLFKFSLSPLEVTVISTGQKILFRGLDDAQSITSITVTTGSLNLVWFEEAYQISKEDDFNKIDMSIRGIIPDDHYKQLILTFNPWSDKHWIKKRFFDTNDDNVLAITTNYMCNEWLSQQDLQLFENMKHNNPRRYHIEGLGNWGVSKGLVYENFIEESFEVEHILKTKNLKSAFGLDFGYSVDPSAFVYSLIDEESKTIYVCDEFYRKQMTNQNIAEMIKYMGYGKEKIIADSAEPKSIAEIKRAGITRIEPAAKGKDSILNGIQLINNYKIIIHPKCKDFIIEINNYVYDTKNDNMINKPIDAFNHLMDAFRYSISNALNKGKINIMNSRTWGI